MATAFNWYWGNGDEPDSYRPVEPSTRDAAIAAARAEDAHLDGFTIVEANKKAPTANIFDADKVIEQYEEHNEQCWGDDGAEIHANAEQKNELRDVLANALSRWMVKHKLQGRLWVFDEMRNEEYFPAKGTVQ